MTDNECAVRGEMPAQPNGFYSAQRADKDKNFVYSLIQQ